MPEYRIIKCNAGHNAAKVHPFCPVHDATPISSATSIDPRENHGRIIRSMFKLFEKTAVTNVTDNSILNYSQCLNEKSGSFLLEAE